jgi:hypothetical protein
MVWDPGSNMQDPGSGKNLFQIPDPGVKKAPDPGSEPQHCCGPQLCVWVSAVADTNTFNNALLS